MAEAIPVVYSLIFDTVNHQILIKKLEYQVECIAKKIRRSIVILSKLRYYVALDILLRLSYGLICPFLTYGIIIWGNTYKTMHSLANFHSTQKEAIRIITFSRFNEHTIVLSLNFLKFKKKLDLVTFYLAIFMYECHNQLYYLFLFLFSLK